ncbi:uncharacterized protein [Musca autumnalis]|uniref:uncharacterized protein n=1 Tax=Musca autumnalis TaxID=221902 RepID=UPI003CF1A934
MEKAAARLLKNLKDDSCFYGPSYNDWIPKVRDELLRRHMFEFWKNIIVSQELGPAWARDCDLFEDSNDPEPAKFYEFNGCKAPWLKDKESEGNKVSTTSTNAIQLKPISLETPLEDYKCNMDIQSAATSEDPNAYNTIFANVRDTIWHLLFKDSKDFIDNESYEKAASLLRQYKKDACLYSPHDYNEWITKVRDNLFVRNQLDFWHNIIVKEQLGLCWAGDSKLFHNLEDETTKEFYNYGKDIYVCNKLLYEFSRHRFKILRRPSTC